MTTPPPTPDGFSPGLLAAYADGELDATTRAAIEHWLADHPAARDAVETQRELSANAALWEQTAPREPSEAVWAAVQRGIERGLRPATPAPRKPWRAAGWILAGLSTTAFAATVLWFALGSTSLPPPGKPTAGPTAAVRATEPELAPEPRTVYRESAPTPSEVVSLAIANSADVVLHRVPEMAEGCLPIGQHPLSGAISLASEVEVTLADVAPSPVWPPGGPRMTTAPGDAPMIFAAKLR